MKCLRNQSGMIDIILIAVVFIAAAALGGYVYYQQQQAKKADTAAGNGVTVATHTKAKTPVATTSTAPYLAVTEWRVRFQMSGESDFTYTLQDAFQITYANFVTPSVASCDIANNHNAAGSLARSTNDPAAMAKLGSQGGPAYTLIKQIGSYYYYYFGPGDSCPLSPSGNISDTQTKVTTSLKADLHTLASY